MEKSSERQSISLIMLINRFVLQNPTKSKITSFLGEIELHVMN
jgi:hypothetical protein